MYNHFVRSFYTDTDPRVDEQYIKMLRKVPGWRKLEMVAEINEAVRALNMAGLRKRYPSDSETQLHRRLAGMLYGEELAEKAYGPLDE